MLDLESFIPYISPAGSPVLSANESIFVGVSGGVDSVVLLDLLFHSTIIQPTQIRIVHVHHGLRGPEADRDAQFVKKLAECYKIPFFLKEGRVYAYAEEHKLSVETAAREFRYTCFEEWSRELQTRHVFLAHHADDQTETILHNLCRGSAGLKGISPLCERGQLILHRPLLTFSRKEIEDYAKKQGLNWCHDSTNDEMIALRNHLRHHIIPELNKAFKRNVSPLINRAEHCSREMNTALFEAIDHLPILDPQGRIHLPTLLTYCPELQRAILHWYLKKQGIPNISSQLVQKAHTLLDSTSPAKINLPGNNRLRRKEKRLFIEWNLSQE